MVHVGKKLKLDIGKLSAQNVPQLTIRTRVTIVKLVL